MACTKPTDLNRLEQRLLQAARRGSLLPVEDYLELLNIVSTVLETEAEHYRPYDSSGLPGGVVYLDRSLPTIILPDLHARVDFLYNMLTGKEPGVLSGLHGGELQVVCVGDGFHGEVRVLNRWRMAFAEFQNGYASHDNMDREMIESLAVMEMVMRVKSAYPRGFHFLKGNHENISNEMGGGNYPFVKFVEEGAMVAAYCAKFLGRDFIKAYYRFEKNMPLLAVGRNVLISHAEPVRCFACDEVIEYRNLSEVVEGFTWTDNDQADPDSVEQMLGSYLEPEWQENGRYFGGHRTVPGRFRLRANGKYVQIHNPGKWAFARIAPDRPIDVRRDVCELKN